MGPLLPCGVAIISTDAGHREGRVGSLWASLGVSFLFFMVRDERSARSVRTSLRRGREHLYQSRPANALPRVRRKPLKMTSSSRLRRAAQKASTLLPHRGRPGANSRCIRPCKNGWCSHQQQRMLLQLPSEDSPVGATVVLRSSASATIPVRIPHARGRYNRVQRHRR